MTRVAVFLDRDGVVNEAVTREGRPFSPASVAEVVITDDARNAVSLLQRSGYTLVVVSNQPEVSRGTLRLTDLNAINEFIGAELGISEFRICPHDDRDACKCRKPKPGMLVTAAAELGIDLVRSALVGDRWRDVGAGRAAGCRTVFIDRGYAEEKPAACDFVTPSVLFAAEWIVLNCPPD